MVHLSVLPHAKKSPAGCGAKREERLYREAGHSGGAISVVKPLTQFVLLYLAHGVTRQFIDKKHPLGLLVLGKPTVQMVDDGRFFKLVFSRSSALLAYHYCGNSLTKVRVR